MTEIRNILQKDEKIYWQYKTKPRILKFLYHLQVGILIFGIYFFLIFLPSITTTIQWIPYVSIIIGPCVICGIFQDIRKSYYEDLIILRELGLKRKDIRKEENHYFLTNKRWIQKDLEAYYLIQKYNLYTSKEITIKDKFIIIELERVEVVIADFQTKNNYFYIKLNCNEQIDLNKIHFKVHFKKDNNSLEILLKNIKKFIPFNFLSRYLKCKKGKKTLIILERN
ncbi:MAG: hypothetical protein GF317_21330 [Candidatus Lokiarchaeota archaeon]|nr:hypothetical protein [Candidatus Lokiarchaeota archaeon]MBD3201999.1 hypothetical protein [Candidatus Lokiarchaeota archaeon]